MPLINNNRVSYNGAINLKRLLFNFIARRITYNKLYSPVTPKNRRLFTITYRHTKNLFSSTMYLVDKSRATKIVYTINIYKESSFLYQAKLAIRAVLLHLTFNTINLIIDAFIQHGLYFGCLSNIRLIHTAIEINCILYACLFNFVFCRHSWGKENV